MTFLPIVGRELRIAARRPMAYWSRVATAGGAILLAGWMTVTLPDWISQTAQGLRVFQYLTWLALILALLAGTQTTATTISKERREGTLGLLFLTDLKGYDVVLGKLAASSLTAIYGLLALLPVLAIPMLMGGVPLMLFLNAVLLLVNSLFFSLVAGLCVSSFTRLDQNARAGTVLLLLCIIAIVPLGVGVSLEQLGLNYIAFGCYLPSPGYAGFKLFERGFLHRPQAFWSSVLTLHAINWLLLGLAAWQTRRAWKDPASTLRSRRWGAWRRQWRFGRPVQRIVLRRRLLAVHPILWLSGRDRWVRRYVWGFLVFMTCVWWWGYSLNVELMVGPGGLCFCFLTCFHFKLWVATESTQSFFRDPDPAALELLLTIPLRGEELARGHWLVLRHLLAGPVSVMIILQVAMFAASWNYMTNSHTHTLWIGAWVANLIVFLLDAWALGWVVLRAMLHHRRTHQALLAGLGRIMLLPWLLLAGFTGLVALLQTVPTMDLGWVIPGWLMVSFYVDMWYGIQARYDVLHQMRQLATEPVVR